MTFHSVLLPLALQGRRLQAAAPKHDGLISIIPIAFVIIVLIYLFWRERDKWNKWGKGK